jgi:hypothetical protein
MIRLQTRGATLDHESFPVPQPGLFADLHAGVGHVALPDEFRNLPSATKLAVLVDWQSAMEKERRMAVAGLFREVAGNMGDAPLPAKIDHFRGVCARNGVDCPADLAILLQQV